MTHLLLFSIADEAKPISQFAVEHGYHGDSQGTGRKSLLSNLMNGDLCLQRPAPGMALELIIVQLVNLTLL